MPSRDERPHQSQLEPSENKFHLGNGNDGKHYWITPPELLRDLEAEFAFDFDPCPFPLPEGFDGLICDWGQSNYVNPPFGSIIHQGRKKGPTAWARKAIAEHEKGKQVVLVYPIDKWVLMLLKAGAQVRTLGDVRWLATEDGSRGKGTGRGFALKGPKMTDFLCRSVIICAAVFYGFLPTITWRAFSGLLPSVIDLPSSTKPSFRSIPTSRSAGCRYSALFDWLNSIDNPMFSAMPNALWPWRFMLINPVTSTSSQPAARSISSIWAAKFIASGSVLADTSKRVFGTCLITSMIRPRCSEDIVRGVLIFSNSNLNFSASRWASVDRVVSSAIFSSWRSPMIFPVIKAPAPENTVKETKTIDAQSKIVFQVSTDHIKPLLDRIFIYTCVIAGLLGLVGGIVASVYGYRDISRKIRSTKRQGHSDKTRG